MHMLRPNKHIMGLRQDNVSENQFESAIILTCCIAMAALLLLMAGCNGALGVSHG